jgi:hypothetical protein
MANINSSIKPTWQLHDLNNNPEHELMRDYIVEFTDIAGIEIWYHVRDESRVEIDDIYGEPKYVNTRYRAPTLTKLLYEVTEEPHLTTGFGINSEDMVQYASMPKFTWSRDVSAVGRPKPGDVIQTVWNTRSYEITEVHEEDKIFQLRKLVWDFILRPYRFSEQSESAADIAVNLSDDDVMTIDPTTPDITTSIGVSGFGDNPVIETESDEIYNYGDVDESIYGY